MSEPGWFHVFDPTTSRWLQVGKGDADSHSGRFAHHGGAAEFESYEAALEAARECLARDPELYLIVLADFGSVEGV